MTAVITFHMKYFRCKTPAQLIKYAELVYIKLYNITLPFNISTMQCKPKLIY